MGEGLACPERSEWVRVRLMPGKGRTSKKRGVERGANPSRKISPPFPSQELPPYLIRGKEVREMGL